MRSDFPMLAHLYGLKPWEIAGGADWLSDAEHNEFVEQAAQIGRQKSAGQTAPLKVQHDFFRVKTVDQPPPGKGQQEIS